MRLGEPLDPFRSLHASWSLLRAGGGGLWIRGLLLFIGEVGGAGALALAISAWPSRDSFCGNAWGLREIRVAGTVGLILFVATCAAWRSLARATARTHAIVIEPPPSPPRLLAVLSARFASEVLSLAALLPTLASMRWTTGSTRLAALFLCLCCFAYVSLGLSFVPQVAVFEGRGVFDCVRRSWKLARGNRLTLLLYRAALCDLAFVSACSGIGIFVAAPLVNVARVESSLALTRERDRAAPPA